MPTWAISAGNPIRLAWFAVALPALVLNYFGQAGLLITDATAIDNPFYPARAGLGALSAGRRSPRLPP